MFIERFKKKIKKAKPEAEVTTPSTASIKALKRLNLNKIAIFTPYPKKLNDEVIDFFKKEIKLFVLILRFLLKLLFLIFKIFFLN